MEAQNRKQQLRKKKKQLREWLNFFLCLILALGIALLLRVYVYEFVEIRGDSMEPTLSSGEFVFVEKLGADTPERGDILIVRYPDDENYYIKRLIGMPGDIVSVEEGQLYIDGAAQEEDYLLEPDIRYEILGTLVPEGCYFVLGDNRNNSQDSHSASVGVIPEEAIVGRALFVLWPLPSIRGLSAK